MEEYQLSDEQRTITQQFEDAKSHLALMKSKYKKVVTVPMMEHYRQFPFPADIKSASVTLGNGKQLIYLPPREYFALKKEFTTEVLRFKVPEAYETRIGYEQVKVMKEDKEDDN